MTEKRALWGSVRVVMLAAVAAFAAEAVRGGVVINEIHYNPPEGAQLELVELLNTDAQAVNLSGWSFNRGIQYVFPEGSVIEAGGYAVVCQNRAQVSARFGLAASSLFGEFQGSLDNGGETLTLVDAGGAVADEVRYDDDAPWDKAADGAGPSLERICAGFDSSNPANWTADPSLDPTPGKPNHTVQCPPPTLPPPRVAINEINYHPLNDQDAKEEFVELRNNAAEPVDLKGYAFVDGIDFIFQDSLVLEPGGIVVVCRDRASLQAKYGVTNVAGDFTGQLANDGERITLLDAAGAFVDSVRYSDGGDWPVAADGQGYSLEKVVPDAPSDDPASWKEAGLGDLTTWRHVTVAGPATSSRLLLYIDGPAEFFLDNIQLIDPANPGVNFIPNGTFDAGIDPWVAKGNHVDSGWDSTGGPDGSGAIHVVASGKGSGPTNGIALDTVPELVRTGGPSYQLSFDFKYVTGATGLTLKVSGATAARGVYFVFGAGPISSPGKPNTVLAAHVSPFVSAVGRSIRQPRSTDAVSIRARARADGPIASLKLEYSLNGTGTPAVLDMVDDGAHDDILAGDGVYGAQIPAAPHNTVITYRITAVDSRDQSTLSPPKSDPTGVYAFYVNDLQADGPLPNYTLLVNHTGTQAPRAVMAGLNCQQWRDGAFAVEGDCYWKVGIRQRGQSVCGSQKPYLKLRFQRGRDFKGQHKLNLQSLWTDKSLVREKMAWEAFRDVGMPYCYENYVRIHVNGKYYGLYGELEHPDSRFLARNNLNPDGNLYKATASTEEATGTYEKKTNESDTSMTDLRTFLSTMHATPRANLRQFFEQNVDEDRVIDYQLAQTLTNNSDYPHKNHYLYHDTQSNKWMPLTWDMDLTFGKIWDGTYGGVLHDKMHTPGNNPWYTTAVDGGLGNHLLDKFFYQSGDWYRRAYIVRLWDALQEKYTEEFFEEKIGVLHDLIFDEQAEDIAAWGRSAATADDRTAPKEFEPNLQRVKDHIHARRDYLINYLKTRHKFTGHDQLKITELMYNPAGSAEDLEFLELWNPSTIGFDAAGWSIEGIGYVFPEGVQVGPNEVIVVAKDPVAFRATYGEGIRVLGPYDGNLDNDGEILRVKDAGPGYPATVDFLRYGTTGDWPREGDGLGYSIELTEVSPTRDNDLGVYWKRSEKLGGTPGVVEVVNPSAIAYRRGDTTSDQKINLTDAIAILRYMFQGSGEPECLAAADIDGSGDLKLDDPILLLKYLFQDGSVKFPAPGVDGCAPAPEGTCKQSNCRL